MYTLDDICTLITDGSHFSPEDEGIGYPMLSVKDMGDEDFDFSSCKYVGEEAYQKLLANGCKPLVNDVVVAKDGSYLKTAFPIKKDREIALLSSIAILRPDLSKVNSTYLSYFLKSDFVYRLVSLNYISGTALKRIILKGIKKIPVDLPTIDDQLHRVALLDGLSEIIRLRQKELRSLDDLIKARFVEMFAGEKNLMAMSDICSIITDGTHQPPKFKEDGIPFIFVSNITNDKLTYEAEKFIDQDTYNELVKRTPIEIGDVLLSTVGSYGHPAVVKSDKKFLFQRHIAYLKPKREIVDSDYLHGAILSPGAQRQIEQGVKGIAQKTLNLSEIKKMRIPIPNMDKQKEFATFVAQVDKSKAQVQKALDEIQLLFDSLMQEYFG